MKNINKIYYLVIYVIGNLIQNEFLNIKVYVKETKSQKTHKMHKKKLKKNKDYTINMINFMHNLKINGEYNTKNL